MTGLRAMTGAKTPPVMPCHACHDGLPKMTGPDKVGVGANSYVRSSTTSVVSGLPCHIQYRSDIVRPRFNRLVGLSASREQAADVLIFLFSYSQIQSAMSVE